MSGLLNESSLELADGKIRAAHELHQTFLPGADLFDGPLDARQPSLRNFHQTVFVTMQQIAGLNFDSENLNGNADAHDFETGVADHRAPREVVEAKAAHFRHVANATIRHQPHRAQ